jgi:hypothetical protein
MFPVHYLPILHKIHISHQYSNLAIINLSINQSLRKQITNLIFCQLRANSRGTKPTFGFSNMVDWLFFHFFPLRNKPKAKENSFSFVVACSTEMKGSIRAYFASCRFKSFVSPRVSNSW